MIVLKTKIVETVKENQVVEISKYKHKHSTTAEHIVAIGYLIDMIMKHDKNMSITRLMKLVKENYESQK